MPPAAIDAVTTSPASTTPTQYGVPLTRCSTTPAPLNCGTRYSHMITSTMTAQSLRIVCEPSR